MMTEMTNETRKWFDAFCNMKEKQQIRIFYEVVKYMHENLEYGENDDMNNLIEDIANVRNDIEDM